MAIRDALPPAEVDKLTSLRGADTKAFRARVRDLRKAGWTLASIADPFGSPRSTARAWELGAPSLDEVPAASVPTAPRVTRASAPKTRRLRPDVPADELKELQHLAESARTVRGWTPKSSPARKDAEELERRLEIYVSRGVPVKRLARHMGVTYRAVAARLERRAARESEVSHAA